MYENQTEQIIKQRMLDSVPDTVDKSEGSFINDALAPAALEIAQNYIELDDIIKLAFAQTSYGEYLTNRAAEFGVIRKPGTKATGYVVFVGNDGVTIPKGTIVSTDSGLNFLTTFDAIISEGYGVCLAEAEDIGVIYNIPALSINKLQVQITGVSEVLNPSIMEGGSNIETDDELLKRFLLKVQTPSTSGNANDYKLWALDVPGVGDAKVFPIWNGNGTVKVVVINSEKKPADNTLLSDIVNKIEANRPIGATVTVISAAAVNINISVTVTRDSSYSLSQVTTNITDKVTTYLKSVAFKSNYVSYAQIGNAIIDAEGVLDYSNLTVNNGTVNISIGAEQVAVLGAVSVN